VKYSEESIHQLIKSFAEVDGGNVVDVCEEYFTLQRPNFQEPLQLTYQPIVSREKDIDLIATGSSVLESILNECLQKGHVCSLSLTSKLSFSDIVRKYFKDSDYSCDFCEKSVMGDKEYSFCVKSPRCYHKINNATIQSIKILKSEKIKLFQFYFLVFFKNKLKKSEEIINIFLDDQGQLFDYDIIENEDVEFVDSNEPVNLTTFDSLMRDAYEKLDHLLQNKKNIFDMVLKKEISRRISNIEGKLEEEKLQQSISKKAHLFNEKTWRQKKNKVIERETQALRTRISIKFVNLLIGTTNKVTFEILLSNNSKISSSLIVGLSDKFEIVCPSCEQTFETGYATSDSFYLCEDCIRQSIETGNVYSNDFQLARDSTTNEFIESDAGFVCSVCGRLNSNKFKYNCNEDNSLVCCRCYELCHKCEKIFSAHNLETCIESSKCYCNQHVVHCSNCDNPVGIDKYRLCKASAKKLCSCTSFQKCDLCEVEYSFGVLHNNKCPACNGLTTLDDESILSPIIESNPSYKRTKNWLAGKNAKNLVIIAKGRFSDMLFVIENENIVFSNKLSLLRKMKGY